MKQLNFNFTYSRKHEYLEGQTIQYWADYYNVSRQRIYQRIEKTGGPHPSVRKPGRPRIHAVKPIEMYNGYTYEQLAEMYGVSRIVISNRIRWYGDKWTKSLKKA